MMKLENLDFIKLLPQFMRDDKAVQGLSAGMNKVIPKVAERVKTASTWDCIDKLSEAELDALAWELNILWYDYGADIGIKRSLVKNSDAVHQSLGTKWACENVIKSYFGSGYIEEWFEYDGEPGHFRVFSSNPTVSNEKLLEFVALLNKVKRASAKLDGIYLTLTGELLLSAGAAMHEATIERYETSI